MKRVLLCAALLAWSGMASAIVYKWVDAQGKVQYGDHPPDGVHAVVVELLGNHAPRAAGAAAPTAPPVRSTTSQPPATTPGPDDAARKAVEGDVAKTRDQQCTDAQERYKKLIEGRKLYKSGPDGERQYLSSEEIDSERISAKRDLDTLCNAGT
jgi:Domain of unknown function (DUF4124)